MFFQHYDKISGYIRERTALYKTFVICYKSLPILVIGTYVCMVLYGVFRLNFDVLLRIILVPAVTFLFTTIFRKLINEKRPYEVHDIQPLIPKAKKGESFPSRHMVSVTIIAMTGWYLHPVLGIWLTILTLLVGIMRPLAGVHYIHDVIGAAILSIVCGLIGFFL